MKNQLKKSLSLLMAVLMILSCWVWVAPDKAEAFDNLPSGGGYKFELVCNIVNEATNGGHAYVYYFPWKADGTGVDTSKKTKYTGTEFNSLFKNGQGTTVTYTIPNVPGWPCEVFIQVNHKNLQKEKIELKEIRINDINVCGGTWTFKNKSSKTLNYKKGNETGSPNPWAWELPYFKTVSTLEVEPSDVTLAKLPNSANVTVNFRADGKDQYGTQWGAKRPTTGFTNTITYIDATGNTKTVPTSNATISSTDKVSYTGSVSINNSSQKLFPAVASGTFYLNSTYGGITVTKPIKLYNPEYTITFDANGGKIGADDSTAADTVTVGGTDSKMYYDSVIGKSPAYRVKAGKEFMGFYSTQNADATGKTASFSGIMFKDGETKVDANGDRTWYAAWQSLPVTATFVTADNQLIGTLEGRYDNNLEATNMYNGLSGVNAALKEACKNDSIKWSGNDPVYTDGATTYTFSHWNIIKAYDDSVLDGDTTTTLQGDVTYQAVYTKADSAKYSVKFYDGNGNVINDASNRSDYNYREDVILPLTEPTKAQDDRYNYEFIGWAKNIGKNFYAVDENNKDENGAVISYTEKEAAEFTVRGDASYVPVFRMIPREYSVTFNYTVDGGATESVTVGGYHWLDDVTLPEEIKDNYTQGGYRYYIDGWKVGSNATKKQLDSISVNGDLSLTATYGAGEPAQYTINFYDKDGNLLNADTNIFTHNSDVTAPEIYQRIDTEDSLFTFDGFKDKNGNTYSQTATADADYYAEYTRKDYADIHFYNYDGTLLYELDGKKNSLFVGDTIPAYSNSVTDEEGNTTEVLPTKAEDEVGTYNFTGWADDDGAPVVPGTDKFAGDTYLYAQFDTVYNEYTVKFMNGEEVFSKGTYHYGYPIVIPEEKPSKDSDETYYYSFKAWDPDVSEVCYGDATYAATYRSAYNYYKVTWLKDDKSVHTAANYIYNEKIQQTSAPASVKLGTAGEGYTWVIKEWIRCNAAGEPVDNGGNVVDEAGAARFVRGTRMGTTELFFYPTYVKKANVYTVKYYNADGTTLVGEAKIPHGDNIAAYGEDFETEAVKAADKNYHYIFKEWITLEGTAIDTAVDDISVKAYCTPEEHNKQIYEVVKAPTCTETGVVNMKCESDTCDLIELDVIVEAIPDEGKPTGQVYVGQNLWKDSEFDSIDYDDVVYVGPSTNAIVNAEDTGTRSMPWNNEGTINRGVNTIDYYVSEKEVVPSTISVWTNAYSYSVVYNEVLESVLFDKGISEDEYSDLAFNSTKKNEIDNEVKAILASYRANVTSNLAGLNLVNGKEYIIYIRVTDRAPSGKPSNVAYFSTGTLHYGSIAPTINVTGNGYGTKFCEEATFTVTDDLDGFTVTLDGEAVTLTDGKYTTTEKGVHVITAVDKNGNKSTKTFEIKGNHTYRNYSVSATCEKAGSRYDLCTLCGVKANEEVLPATGHNFTTYTEKTATCVTDGYRMYSCANGCGETLQIKWNSADDVLAQAKKYDEATEKWESITAADVAHLKATGTHTYAKVKNEDGSDSTEDAWVIDKAATCIAAGSKHKDCTVCGARVTEEIPIDPTAHNYYRPKTAQEPTCTEQGWKNQTCKICGHVKVQVEMIPALGHTAGEYRIIKEATCEAKGEKVLKCSVCGVDIGKADENGNYAETPVKEEIPALGHAWKLVGDPYKGDKVDDEGNTVQVWYQKYVCANDSTHTKVEETEYEEKVAAIVTFKNGDDDAAHAVIKDKYVGESIIATDVAEPTKAADATYKYSFAYWATKDADGKYIEAKFPIEIKGNETYYAVYTEKYINYTITYMKDDGITQYKKVGYLHNGDVVELADGPAKSGDTYYTYTFAGWKLGDNTYTDKFTIDGSDVTLVATYTNKLKQYAVTYAYTKNNILETFLVDAGSFARECYTAPVKEKESGGHYEFTGWNKAEQLKNVESNIYTTPTFKLVDHIYETSHVSDATCTSNEIKKNTCTECGYFYEFEVEGTILDHDWVVSEADGKYTKTCSRCGESTSQSVTYTIDYYKDGKVYTHSYNVVWGTVLSTVVPTTPTKASDEYYSYTFKGWALKDDATETIINPADIKVKGNMSLVAVFDKTDRTYTVTFAYDAKNVIKIYKNVKAGSAVVYDGPVPTKKYDDSYHYVFDKWSATTDKILKDTYVKAEFRSIEHENTPNVTAATCTTGQGTNYTCSCGWSSGVTETAKPLGHALKEMTGAGSRVEPTEGKDGYVMYECTRCDYVEKRVLKWEDPTTGLVKITVTVKDQHDKPVNGATVALYQDSNWVAQDITNANGQVSFLVAPGKYTVVITGVKYAGDQQSEITVNGNGSISGSIPQMYINDCGCACHRDNLWGTIFRFFHKIIKMLTGEFKCCKDPSDLYY